MNIKQIFYFIGIFFLFIIKGQSQDFRVIDSLRLAANKAIPDSTKADLLQNISFKFQQIDLDSGIKYGKQSLRIAEKIKDKRRIAAACMITGNSHMGVSEYDFALGYYKRAMKLYFETGATIDAAGTLNNIGLVFWNKSDYPRALNCFFNVLELSKIAGKKRYVANAYGNIGLIYWSMSDFENALEYQLKCLRIREEQNDKEKMAVCLSNIGIDYQSLHDYNKALEYHLKTLKIIEELGLKQLLGTTYGNLGVVYSDLGKPEEALAFQEKSLKVHQELGSKDGIALALSNIGHYNERKGDYEGALNYFLKSRQINEEIGAKQNESNCNIDLCNNYTRTKKYKEAEICGNKALALAREIQDIGCESEAESVLYALHKQMKHPDKALEHYEKHIKLQDSIYKKDNEKEIARKEYQYLLYKNESAQKMQQEKRELIHSAQSTQQRVIIGCSAGLLLILIIFSVSLFKRFTITRKQNVIIEEKQREIIDSINYAKRIQNALMSHAEALQQNSIEHFTLFKPKAIVSGDFYWVSKKDNLFYLAVCDSTGHGVPGAFMSLLNISFLNEAINEKNILEPDKMFNYVRERLIESISKEEHQDGFDGILLCFDKLKNKITYAAANNRPVLIQNGLLSELAADKMPVGKGEIMKPYTLHTVESNPGDMLYLFSDGYADQFGGPQGKKFKYKPLNQLLLSSCNESMKIQLTKLEETFEAWKGNLEQVDDVCLIGIKL